MLSACLIQKTVACTVTAKRENVYTFNSGIVLDTIVLEFDNLKHMFCACVYYVVISIDRVVC